MQACAVGQPPKPGHRGSLRRRPPPRLAPQVTALLTKLLSSKPASSYSACASELHRRLHFKTNRASVRRWAIQNHLAPDTRYKTTPKPVKRWQACEEGALWQYDVSPHPWLPDNPSKQALFDILDDATRYNTGTRLYARELLLSHFDFLPRTFQAHGLPLALYVDYHFFLDPYSYYALAAAGWSKSCGWLSKMRMRKPFCLPRLT